MKKVFITRKLTPLAEELLSKHFQVDSHPENTILPREKLIHAVQTYDGILSTIPDRFDKEVLKHAGPNLKVICTYSIGLDSIDVNFAESKGITVCNVPDAVTNSSADHTFAIFLSLLRQVPESQAFVRENKWTGWDPWIFLGEDLPGKTFGIVGYGRIGQAVARRALGFDLKVLVYNRSQKDMGDSRIQQVTWDTLLEEVDVLSLHAPLTDETRGLIDYTTIKKMKKRPYLINMARGPLVRTDDLVRALDEDLLRGAALDVTDPEPLSGDHPLCHKKNCLVVPHTGTSTLDAREIMARDAASRITQVLIG